MKKPVTLTMIDYIDGEHVTITRMISYDEAIHLNYEILDEYLGYSYVYDKDDYMMKETIEVLEDIIKYTIKNILQKHCTT